MTDLTPEALDEWRMEQAYAAHPSVGQHGIAPIVVDHYRKLVRENAQPPAEPDQDTLDTFAVLEAWNDCVNDDEARLLYFPGIDFPAAKAALTEIKARVRREAIGGDPTISEWNETLAVLDPNLVDLQLQVWRCMVEHECDSGSITPEVRAQRLLWLTAKGCQFSGTHG